MGTQRSGMTNTVSLVLAMNCLARYSTSHTQLAARSVPHPPDCTPTPTSLLTPTPHSALTPLGPHPIATPIPYVHIPLRAYLGPLTSEQRLRPTTLHTIPRRARLASPCLVSDRLIEEPPGLTLARRARVRVRGRAATGVLGHRGRSERRGKAVSSEGWRRTEEEVLRRALAARPIQRSRRPSVVSSCLYALCACPEQPARPPSLRFHHSGARLGAESARRAPPRAAENCTSTER